MSGMNLVYEGETQSHCVIEHNRGKFFLFTDSARDSHHLLFCDTDLSSTNDWQVRFTFLWLLTAACNALIREGLS
jgi:hypothetical protein